MADDGSSSLSSSSSTPTPTIIILPETSQLHPLQHNFREGPKGAYEVKRDENGVFVRVDMPGVSEINFHAVKISNQIVRFQGFAPKLKDWPLDESTRFYVGKMKVESDDFDAVSIFKKSFSNGCGRFLIKGATNVSLFLDTGTNKKVEAPTNQLHLTPTSLLIVGVANEVHHLTKCACCHGQKVFVIPTGAIHEDMGYINPFLYNGVKGVFEARFEELADGSGAHRLYFRLDMPDCTAESYIVNVQKHHIVIKGYLCIANTENEEHGGRKYSCEVRLRCSCCSFDTSPESLLSNFDNGVLRMVVKVKRHMIMIKEKKTTSVVSVRVESSSSSPTPAESSKSGPSKQLNQ